MKNPRIQKIKNIIFTGLIMILGLILLKYIPMYIWGKNILFDASAHLTITFFIIYAFVNLVNIGNSKICSMSPQYSYGKLLFCFCKNFIIIAL